MEGLDRYCPDDVYACYLSTENMTWTEKLEYKYYVPGANGLEFELGASVDSY